MSGSLNWGRYTLRTCKTLHTCRLCSEVIRAGQQYRDGGYSRRAHVQCVDKEVEPLNCGHPRSSFVAIRYRCNLFPHQNGCREMHLTAGCGVCFDEGIGRPDDFGHEVFREFR